MISRVNVVNRAAGYESITVFFINICIKHAFICALVRLLQNIWGWIELPDMLSKLTHYAIDDANAFKVPCSIQSSHDKSQTYFVWQTHEYICHI